MPKRKKNRPMFRVGMQARVVNSPHNSVPNGTIVTLLAVQKKTNGNHIFKTNNHRLPYVRYDEIERID